MIVDPVKIENEIAQIWEKETTTQSGFIWKHIAEYVAIQILTHRIDQENNSVPVSVLDLELAQLKT